MGSLENTWRDSTKEFKQQLSRNIYELNGKYPPNWVHFINRMPKNIDKVVEIGCGAGTLCEICKIFFPHIKYIGYDYAASAIDLARNTWGKHFEVKKYQDLTADIFSPTTLLVANALADVLENGDECIEFLLGFNPGAINLQRVRITDRESYFETCQAYDIQTYEYHHNYQNLIKMLDNSQYKYIIDYYNSNIIDIIGTKC